MSDSEKGLKQKRCFVGFDAFIDFITRPIICKENGVPRYFHDLNKYATFLLDMNDKSFSIELEIPRIKMGGNNPNMSGILSNCGVDVVSFGAYGKTSLDPVFLPLAKQCRLVSFANPGKCTAYEFNVNKIMNFYNMDKRDFTWENLLAFISADEIIDLLNPADIIIFVNLAEQPAVLNIMEMFLKIIFPHFTERKHFFMDFSDCSHMTSVELKRSFDFIRNLESFGTLTLSVNENEYRQLSGHAGFLSEKNNSCDEKLASFREAIGASQVILRTLETFYFSSSSLETQVPNKIVEDPQFLTGAGDAQNAGFCLGILAGMPIEEMLLTGVYAGNNFINIGEVKPEFISIGGAK